MNRTGEIPIYESIQHERLHKQVLDPSCELCAAVLRHPAGTGIAERAEQAQHDDQQAADEAVTVQDERTWLTARARLLTGCAIALAVLGLAVAFWRPMTGWHLAGVLVVLGGTAPCAVAAWKLRDRISAIDRDQS